MPGKQGNEQGTGVKELEDSPTTSFVLLSAPVINEFIEDLAGSATTEIISVQPGCARTQTVLDRALVETAGCLARGIRVRTIYQHAGRFSEPMKDYVRRVTELGGEIRTLADSHCDRMVIVDRKVAIISTAADRSRATVIADLGIVGFLLDMYERAWSTSKPFNPTGPRAASAEVVPEIRSQIRKLLVAGYSGGYIARRVGLRKRAYDNHIAAIKTELGASNLVQLGFLLAQDEETASVTQASRLGSRHHLQYCPGRVRASGQRALDRSSATPGEGVKGTAGYHRPQGHSRTRLLAVTVEGRDGAQSEQEGTATIVQ